MASQPVVLLKEETWGPGSEGQSFREVNESLRELRSVVNEQFARQKDILMNLTLQVSEMQLQSGAGRLFRPQVSCDSVPGISKSVDDFATPVTESMDMQAREFQMPAMEASTSLKAGHHATTSRHSSDGIASVRLSPGEAISELPKSSRPGQRESVKSDFYAMQEKVQKSFISAFKEPPLVPGSLCAYRIVNSKTSSAMISGLIFLNLVLLGAEVDASSGLPLDVQLESFYVLNNILVSIFVVEVVLKVSAYKCRGFFSGIDRWWNLFDLLIVLLSVLEIVADLIAQSLSDGNGQFMDISHLRVMRFARLVRALRGIRVIRLLRYISGLRTILFSIVSTMSAVLWTMLLLLMLFFCFAVLLAQIVTDHCRSQADLTCDETLHFFWHSVGESMLTLFLSITGGISWQNALAPLREISTLAAVAYLAYIIIAVFAILNVVTGVFCNMAIESARADKDMAVLQQMRKHAAQVDSLRLLFKEIDNDGSSVLTLPELKEALRTENMANFMQSLEISTQDVWTLFTVIDADNSGEITLDEFVFGCMHLQGPAKGVQMARLQHEATIIRKEMRAMRRYVDRLKTHVLLADRQARSERWALAEIKGHESL